MLARQLAAHYGVKPVLEDITAALKASGVIREERRRFVADFRTRTLRQLQSGNFNQRMMPIGLDQRSVVSEHLRAARFAS
jgi:hypothetical protein